MEDTVSTVNTIPEEEFIELEQDFIVLAIPADTAEINIEASVFHGGKVEKVGRKFEFGEIREMFKEAQDGYIPSDALFSLAPVGKDRITRLVEKYIDSEND